MKSFINKDVADILNMKPGTVSYYTNKGFVTPEIADPKGRGTTRRYSCRNLVEFLMILELQKHGLSLPKIKKILEQTKNIKPDLNSQHITLIIYDDSSDMFVEFRTTKNPNICIDINTHDSAIIINLSRIWEFVFKEK